MDPEATGISFNNDLSRNPDFNILNYLNYYNGGGVAIGDVNNDGLQDVYFTANEGPNRLYLNRGSFRFEDVTEQAGVAGSGDWTTGATMADVNADGYVDIYVSVVSGYRGRTGTNQLFVNNGDGTFSERAARYGLDQAGLSTHASFFDYDGDGDLDVYLVNHSDHVFDTFGPAGELRYERHPLAGDRLLRNDDGTFVDVSEQAGIHGGVVGYGLSVVTSDLNLDGCPDIYVANDFHENDYLYYNNCDGTFRESVRTHMGHNSRSSMGVDAGDVNNDGLPDLMVVDMLPEDETIRKTTALEDRLEVYDIKRRAGYYEQFSRNVLQINRGGGRFSDVAAAARVEATDWSWAVLFADLDNDGYQDVFVTNGIVRRPIDLDYIDILTDPDIEASMQEGIGEMHMPLVDAMPHQPSPNYAFKNNRNLTFTNEAKAWGLGTPGFSNGAAYADLDNDGDLDLVVSNIDQPASIYRNRAVEKGKGGYLQVVLEGAGGNTDGVGARVILKTAGETMTREQLLTRGFQSSVDPRLHFGLGDASIVDSLTVIWNDGTSQTLTEVPVDTTVMLQQSEASYPRRASATGEHFVSVADEPSAAEDRLFEDVSATRMPAEVVHRERPYNDWEWQPLIPQKLSTEGPAMAVGDVDGDGLDDLFLGGASAQPASIVLQTREGRFRSRKIPALEEDSLYEDVDASLFDADGDGDLDLYVVSAGNEIRGQARILKDRLYLNDGTGSFAEGLLPPLFENGSVVQPADADADGDTDLFVGTRIAADGYGACARSHLLKREGSRFVDATPEGMQRCDRVLDAAWADVDGNGRADLIVVGMWMRPRIYLNLESGFESRSVGAKGWWSSVRAADVNDDGFVDLVLGNHGLNSTLRAAPDRPVRLYVGDFDANGTTDHLLTRFVDGASAPIAGRDELLDALPSYSFHFPTYLEYAKRSIGDILSTEQLRRGEVLEAHVMSSMVAVNDGRGSFSWSELPLEAQLAPMRAILVDDFNGDGHVDVIMGGNFHGVEPVIGRFDASYGAFLEGDGTGSFESVPPRVSGLWLEGEIRDLEILRGADGRKHIVAAVNDGPPQLIRVRP